MDASGIDVWGGIECTVCRIGDAYNDQIQRSGHHRRESDLAHIASLGITHLRYPVLWERIAPDGLEKADWSWTDERLERLRELNVVPIVTLLHHGSGPRYTNLLDQEFPRKLAEFAGAVARRYPWLRFFTPVNEPVTTARFSALYGWWYPHRTDELSFYQAIFNQISAIGRAMEAIRRHIPEAHLIPTEDLGKTYASPLLHYQARHENARRFLSYDLLCGTLDRNPLMGQHLLELGFRIDRRSLEALECRPHILGYNYYVTGERWLDEAVWRYPQDRCGSNGRHRYADVEAVRARLEGIAGPGELLRECWNRYGLPLALTEAHLACSHDEQIRWLRDMHDDLRRIKAEGVDARAITAWSLLGAFDWNSALTRQDGYYESGAFEVSDGTLRETPVAKYIRQLARGSRTEPRSCTGPGWWRRPERLTYIAMHETDDDANLQRPA